VTMLVRSTLQKSMSHYLIEQISGRPNIVVRTGTVVTGAEGTKHLERLRIAPTNGGEEEELGARAMFVFIGAVPCTDWVGDRVVRDEHGFVLGGQDLAFAQNVRWPLARDPYLLESSLPGVFVAGDVRHRSIKRVASAVGEGSMAVQFIHQYLEG
jgi:thioredoxin reductase (NADPH)